MTKTMKKEEALPAITLDFKKDNVQVIDLPTLKRTIQELDTFTHEPIRGMLHWQIIDRVMELARLNGLNARVDEIFAAHNPGKIPGVTQDRLLITQYGDHAIETYCLRRVYTTLHINNEENDETDTGLVITSHQDGVQIAIGPNVKMCHNQCILSAERIVSNYGGDGKVKDFDKMFAIVDDWMKNFSYHREQDTQVMQLMKDVNCSYRDVAELIGHLTLQRVGVDSRLVSAGKYPLNQSQISEFTENYLEKYKALVEAKEGTDMSLWDVYNIATESYKPDRMTIPAILPQNVAWTEMLVRHFNLIN